ncbi:MAG TPA: hypothetical protein V6D17_24575 [Candidatus Obscuribacterales bacterium]
MLATKRLIWDLIIVSGFPFVMHGNPVVAHDARPLIAQESQPALRPAVQQSSTAIPAKRVRKDKSTACEMARYHWLDKACEANPQLVESITKHHKAAMILAKHPRLGDIAETDHYLCRRLTRWKDVSRELARNKEADRVVVLDPEGIYRAIKRDKQVAKILAKNPMFQRMIGENPDLGKLLSTYM